MTLAILALTGAAAAFAAATYWSVRSYQRADRTDRLTTLHAQNLSGRNGHDPSIRAIVDSVGDDVDDTFGPESFR